MALSTLSASVVVGRRLHALPLDLAIMKYLVIRMILQFSIEMKYYFKAFNVD